MTACSATGIGNSTPPPTTCAPCRRSQRDAAAAPQLWQDGHYGRVIDYCLGDIESTLRLFDLVAINGGCRDPRTGEWLNVRVPA